MIELFVVSVVGVLLGVSMLWMSSQQKAERIAVLERENESLRHAHRFDN